MDKTISVTFTVTPEEFRLLTMAFGEGIDVENICRNLLLARAASELRRMVDGANMSRRIRDKQHDRERWEHENTLDEIEGRNALRVAKVKA